MEQRPMHGSGPLDPPSPEVARLYLDEIEVIEQRREERIDRRAVAWQSIVTAVVTAAIFTAYLLVVRAEASAAQPLLFLLLVTSQIIAGVGERNGLQWRTPRSTRWYMVFVVLFALAVVGTFFALLISPEARPMWAYFIPGAIMLVGFGGVGVAQLWKTRGSAPAARPARDPIPLGTRIATASVGLLLALATLSIGVGDDLTTSIVTLVLMMIVVGWFIAWRTDAGPAALGRYWRWPQFLAYALTVVVMLWANVQTVYSGPMATSTYLLCGALVAALLIGSAVLPEQRRARDSRRS
ncbi:hypothetical protein [Microbacterium sp. TPD7012]|uniref:hypothetical protein n=2 Tax=unclassified Microbacterium TaxID=2609290 RepID=UPI000D5239E1|nr:hypothetical protein [Microbacterium sp. TPD7012]PVE95921.1 hypothetical protein DC434_10430 [Microbacterium sp. TPD7012]